MSQQEHVDVVCDRCGNLIEGAIASTRYLALGARIDTCLPCEAALPADEQERLEAIRDLARRARVATFNSPTPSLTRDSRQARVFEWAKMAFGDVEATSLTQRGLRLLEEAVECFQACGGDDRIAIDLVGYVFRRPKGEIAQEIGGVAITLLALCGAAGMSADAEERREFARIMEKPVEHFTNRNAAKNLAGLKQVT